MLLHHRFARGVYEIVIKKYGAGTSALVEGVRE